VLLLKQKPEILVSDFAISAGRIRTYDQLVTHNPKITFRSGLYLCRVPIIRNLGTPVSSLYGAPDKYRGSHGIAPRLRGFTVIPEFSSRNFFRELRLIFTASCSTAELLRNNLNKSVSAEYIFSIL